MGVEEPSARSFGRLDLSPPAFDGDSPDVALDAPSASDASDAEPTELEAGASDPSTDETEPASVEPAPKPRRRRSSRRRGGGAGAAANGAVATTATAEPEPSTRHEPHGVTHGDAVFARVAPPAPAPQQRRDPAPRPERGDGGRTEGGRDSGRGNGGRGEGAGYRDSAETRLRSVPRGDAPSETYARTPAPRPSPFAPRETRELHSLDGGAALVTAREVAHQIADALREALGGSPENSNDESAREKKIALFCDLENIAIGVRDSEIKKFDIDLVLERLLEKGKIIVKKAYADWQRYTEFKKPLHTAGIELIDIPQKYYSGKNSADIKMVVDAMDLCYSKEHLDTFVLLSGDSDFTPLVSKLKENNKHVIGCGVKSSSSKLLIDNCDEFIYYEDIWRDSLQAPVMEGVDEKKAEAFALMNDSISALIRENKSVLWGSMVKQTMQRKRPSFNEGYYGYGSFSDLLEDAERRKLIHLKKDARSGSYVVTGFVRAR
ncbi:MAG TPA: NYN domain-containing protein [Thermoanaerobaculia bacterium]|nr:NYN domain-containing protein [Thermoanaerobaculia bacterium]